MVDEQETTNNPPVLLEWLRYHIISNKS